MQLMRLIAASIKAMPNGPERAAHVEHLEQLRKAMAEQRRLAGLIRAMKKAPSTAA